jgi:hypothetical protein
VNQTKTVPNQDGTGADSRWPPLWLTASLCSALVSLTAQASGLPTCADPPAGVAQLASYVDVKVPAKYWVDMTWQDGEWRPAAQIPMPPHHATLLELTNVTEFAALSAHRGKHVRFAVEIASRDIRKVPNRNEWRATYRARILEACVRAAGR